MSVKIKESFAKADINNNGKIEVEEFQLALDYLNIKLTKSLRDQLIKIYNTDGDTTISFEEFERICKFVMDMKASFNQLDPRGLGALTFEEVYPALQTAGFRIEKEAFDAVIIIFDPDRNSYLKFNDFLALTLFIRKCEKMFTTLDCSGAGNILLDFNQFVYAVSNSI